METPATEQAPAAAPALVAAPPAVTAPAPPVAVPTAPTAESILTGQMDMSTLETLAFAREDQVPQITAPEPTVVLAPPTPSSLQPAPVEASPVEPAPAPVVPAPAPVVPVADDEPAPGEFTKNFRIHADDPKESAFLATLKGAKLSGQPVNVAEIARLVGYELPGTPAADPTPVVQQPTAVDTLNSEIAALQATIREAGEINSPMTPELSEAMLALSTKQAELAGLKAVSDVTQTTAVHTLEAQRKAATEAFRPEAPNAFDPHTHLGAAVRAMYAEIEGTPNHPLLPMVTAVDGTAQFVNHVADLIAPKVAAKQGITVEVAKAQLKGSPPPVAATPAATPQAAPQAIPPVPRTAAVAAPVSGTPAAPAPQLTEKEILERSLTDPKLLEAALSEPSPGFFSLGSR